MSRKAEKLSLTYHIIKSLGVNISEDDYGDITIGRALKKAFRTIFNGIIMKYCMYSALLGTLNYRYLRPKLWRFMGASIGENVFIGYEVYADIGNMDRIIIEDKVHVTNRCLLLCHQRDISNYYRGDDFTKLPYHRRTIHLKKGCSIGMGTIIMPGVTVGEGAIVGAGSVIIKDIPDWTIAIGSPAKVVKTIPERK